jgi:hypothetical protein
MVWTSAWSLSTNAQENTTKNTGDRERDFGRSLFPFFLRPRLNRSTATFSCGPARSLAVGRSSGRFAGAAEFGECGFDLGVQLVQSGDQFVVTRVEPVDQFARSERRARHGKGAAALEAGAFGGRLRAGGQGVGVLPEGTSADSDDGQYAGRQGRGGFPDVFRQAVPRRRVVRARVFRLNAVCLVRRWVSAWPAVRLSLQCRALS